MKRTVMTIAGSDSSGGAGIQADLKTFAALGVHGTCAITAVTAQDSTGVQAIHELPPGLVAAQIDAIVQDMGVDAVKTGMLANAGIVRVVAERVRQHRLPNLVVDPVLAAKSGDRLLREDALSVLRAELLPLCTVVTPNIPEAEALAGRRLETDEDLQRAAQEIAALGARNVVITGGHASGPEAVDLLYDLRSREGAGAGTSLPPLVGGRGSLTSVRLPANL